MRSLNAARPARTLSLARSLVSAAGLAALSATSCYSTGDGANPPIDLFYFPVGLQVSHGGSVLYAVNSDFDLQFNGGTIQSYDLRKIRRDVLRIIADPNDPNVPLLRRNDPNATCEFPPVYKEGGGRQPLGETCAPPVRSSDYLRDYAIIGAFATDFRLSPPPEQLVPQFPRLEREGHPCAGDADCGDGLRCDTARLECATPSGNRSTDRLFAPVRGNASLTWATVLRDRFEDVPPEDPAAPYGPFVIGCGQNNVAERRCDAAHTAGADPREIGNTRGITMPGEPFGLAMSEDGGAIVVTHQNEPKTSLFSTGLSRNDVDGVEPPLPAMQFILEQVPVGGVGVAAVPHDRNAFAVGQFLPRPAFYETSRSTAQVSLLRVYPDQVAGTALGAAFDQTSSLARPFLNLEAGFPITVSAGGADSRGVTIDPSPRIRCKLGVRPADAGAGRTQLQVDDELRACARTPARVFIANRTPPALLVGDVGVTEGIDGAYDPDRLVLHTSVPLSNGPSRVYLAPVVERDGSYSLRVFVVCFDAAAIYVYDPEGGVLENVIRVAPGPAAIAFDPFTMEAAARHEQVPFDLREPGSGLRRYRFAYVASFTQSFVQVIDLDNAQADKATFEKVVFTLGQPTNPKGT